MAGLPVPVVGSLLALVGEAFPVVGSDLGLVQCGPALDEARLRGRKGCFGRSGTGLGLPDPGVVKGKGGQPLALGVLDDLLGQLGQLARGCPGLPPQLPERLVRAGALGGGQDPLGLLDPDSAGQCLAQLGQLDLPGGQLDAGMDELAGHGGELTRRFQLVGVQVRGWIV